MTGLAMGWVCPVTYIHLSSSPTRIVQFRLCYMGLVCDGTDASKSLFSAQWVRHRQVGYGNETPAEMPRPLTVGQRVTARHPLTRQIHDGDVLTVAADTYRCVGHAWLGRRIYDKR